MILECRSPTGRRKAGASSAACMRSLESELSNVERNIRDTADKARCLADELGAKYVVFRCSKIVYNDGREIHNADLIRLSKQADDYIETIYSLEQKRRELMDKLDRLKD